LRSKREGDAIRIPELSRRSEAEMGQATADEYPVDPLEPFDI
jgi:hypothetical protein